ncbi:hypothetical protein PAAG_05104 [Paracoccidioides lutzii Pb01]|uniref:Uncharacterized protein n=1 Tax=Paracoccidioides lutzii (strain ATCC MYA-826 / Pb01) TaxID=502779 RepID=C1H2W1_PARBA|nr:hypothetical protein PAAG_05104 [Paracoccidioides lutzii Pb01]EEH34055.2 hypothetical protein PAAG_05104 [Paracoccidioides lutzii Pb01]
MRKPSAARESTPPRLLLLRTPIQGSIATSFCGTKFPNDQAKLAKGSPAHGTNKDQLYQMAVPSRSFEKLQEIFDSRGSSTECAGPQERKEKTLGNLCQLIQSRILRTISQLTSAGIVSKASTPINCSDKMGPDQMVKRDRPTEAIDEVLLSTQDPISRCESNRKFRLSGMPQKLDRELKLGR